MNGADFIAFREHIARVREQVRSEWARDLPIQELVDDRWERARRLGFGEGSSIYADSYVYGDVEVGAGTWIGPHTLLDGSGGLTIGNGCDISAGVQIYTHDTVRRVLSEGRIAVEHSAVSIGDHCHIGASAIIARGVSIGDHSVIGAAAFVNHDVPPYSVAAGVPARIIGSVKIGTGGEVQLVYGDD